MGKLPYSEEFIRVNSTLISGLSSNDIEKLLMSRTANLIDANYPMDYIDIIKITAFDHYMCQKIINNNNDIRMSKYFNELNKQLLKQPLLYYCLPIRKVNVEILRKYLPNIDKVIIACNQRKNAILTLGTRYSNGEQLSKNEFNALIVFWNFYCNSENSLNEMQFLDKLVKDLLNRDSKLGLHSSSLIMKYFGYKKCQEEGLNDIQIFIGDLTSEGETVLGLSCNKTITISKKHLIGTNFKNNTLSSEHAKINSMTLEGLIALKNLFHELRHAVQDSNYYKKEKNDISYSMSVRKLLSMIDKSEYARDYRFYDIEADANMYGWKWLRTVIKNYMGISEKDRLDIYADIYATEHMIRRDFTAKREDKKINTAVWGFITRKLDLIFKTDPSLLQSNYSHFKVFYNNDGSPRDVNMLIRLNSIEVSSFPDMFFNMVSGRLNENKEIDINYIQSLPLESKKNIIRNLNVMIYHVYSKLSDIKLGMKDGSYLLDSKEFSESDRRVFKKSVENYFNMVKKYSELALNIIKMNPELVGYYGGPQHINRYIENINKNELVKSCVAGQQIECIPENMNDLVLLNSVGRNR